MLPVGVPSAEVVVAVKTTVAPALAGFAELTSVVVVGMAMTVCWPASVTGA